MLSLSAYITSGTRLAIALIAAIAVAELALTQVRDAAAPGTLPAIAMGIGAEDRSGFAPRFAQAERRGDVVDAHEPGLDAAVLDAGVPARLAFQTAVDDDLLRTDRDTARDVGTPLSARWSDAPPRDLSGRHSRKWE